MAMFGLRMLADPLPRLVGNSGLHLLPDWHFQQLDLSTGPCTVLCWGALLLIPACFVTLNLIMCSAVFGQQKSIKSVPH
jgi:hypothetical protein